MNSFSTNITKCNINSHVTTSIVYQDAPRRHTKLTTCQLKINDFGICKSACHIFWIRNYIL